MDSLHIPNYIQCPPQPARSDTLVSDQWILPRYYRLIVALILLLQSRCSYPTSILGLYGVEDFQRHPFVHQWCIV
jgi:hypothetical protein